jgi:hypothetical protein
MTSQQGSENAIIDQIKVSVSPTSSPENIHVYTHTHTLCLQIRTNFNGKAIIIFEFIVSYLTNNETIVKMILDMLLFLNKLFIIIFLCLLLCFSGKVALVSWIVDRMTEWNGSTPIFGIFMHFCSKIWTSSDLSKSYSSFFNLFQLFYKSRFCFQASGNISLQTLCVDKKVFLCSIIHNNFLDCDNKP